MWYYQQGTNRMGPVDEATIRGLLASGAISIDTLVWTNGMSNWAPLQQTPLAAGLPVPPPSPVAVPPSLNPEAKDRIAYVLLALFLGGLGVHNFYAGYNKTGVIQLLLVLPGAFLTCGISLIVVGIWVIIEACTVTKDANGVSFK